MFKTISYVLIKTNKKQNMNTALIRNELCRTVIKNEGVSTHLYSDKMIVVKNLSKHLLGSNVKRAETSSMTNCHDVCDLFGKKASEKCWEETIQQFNPFSI